MTDPAGLDAAIEAGWLAYLEAGSEQLGREATEAAVRAAAPRIRRAALLEAADKFSTDARNPDVEASHAMAYGYVAHWLRERAEREVPGE